MADDQRFEALEKRVAHLEREADGEQSVTRHILQECRANMDLLALVASPTGRTEVTMTSFENRLGSLETKFDAYLTNFPKIVADVVREVLAERKA
jgi:hypothetical protein